MNGSQVIKQQNDPTITNDRHSAQYKGDANGGSWYVFDSLLNGWGSTPYAKARDAQQAADALNAV